MAVHARRRLFKRPKDASPQAAFYFVSFGLRRMDAALLAGLPTRWQSRFIRRCCQVYGPAKAMLRALHGLFGLFKAFLW